MATITFKSRYQPHEPRKYSFTCTDESRTQQQFKAECDINNILAKYRKTGLVTHLSKHQGHFGDFSTLSDYQTSLSKIMQANDSFSTLPSSIRSKFENDPGKLIDFLSDPKNNEEAYSLGLKIKPKETEPSIQQSMENALEANDKKRTKKPTSP